MRVDIRGDIRAVTRDLNLRVPELTKKAVTTALNKTNDKINTRFKRDLASRTGIQQKILNKTIRKYRATFRSQRARVWMGFRRGVPLASVTKGKRPNSRFEPMASESLGGSTFDNVFQMPNGRWVVRTGASRLPVKAIKLDVTRHAAPALKTAGEQVGPREFRNQLARDLTRRLKKVGTGRRTSGGGRRTR